MSDSCVFSGPYHPVGDIDWVCRTHGDVVLELRDPERVASRSNLRCPVAEPHDDDPPLAYENRSPGGART